MPRLLKSIAPALVLACGGDPLLEGVASRSVTSGDLRIHTVFALPPFTDAPLPVYLTVENRALVADTLLAASSTASGTVMFHGAGMATVPAVAVPARGVLTLQPGGLHLMLEPPLDRDYGRGDSVAVHLTFARAGELRLVVPVIAYGEADALLPPSTGPPDSLP